MNTGRHLSYIRQGDHHVGHWAFLILLTADRQTEGSDHGIPCAVRHSGSELCTALRWCVMRLNRAGTAVVLSDFARVLVNLLPS